MARSDALASLTETGKTQHHAARVTPPDMAGRVAAPWAQIAIGILNAFLSGAYHGVSSVWVYPRGNISMNSAIGSTGV